MEPSKGIIVNPCGIDDDITSWSPAFKEPWRHKSSAGWKLALSLKRSQKRAIQRNLFTSVEMLFNISWHREGYQLIF